jgi:hypothetical protein
MKIEQLIKAVNESVSNEDFAAMSKKADAIKAGQQQAPTNNTIPFPKQPGNAPSTTVEPQTTAPTAPKQGAWDRAKELGRQTVGVAKDVAAGAGNVSKGIQATAQGTGNLVKGVAQGVNTAGQGISTAAQGVGTAAKGVGQAVGDIGNAAGTGLQGAANAVRGVGDLAGAVTGAVTTPIGSLAGGFKRGFQQATGSKSAPSSASASPAASQASAAAGNAELDQLRATLQTMDQRLRRAGI